MLLLHALLRHVLPAEFRNPFGNAATRTPHGHEKRPRPTDHDSACAQPPLQSKAAAAGSCIGCCAAVSQRGTSCPPEDSLDDLRFRVGVALDVSPRKCGEFGLRFLVEVSVSIVGPEPVTERQHPPDFATHFCKGMKVSGDVSVHRRTVAVRASPRTQMGSPSEGTWAAGANVPCGRRRKAGTTRAGGGDSFRGEVDLQPGGAGRM